MQLDARRRAMLEEMGVKVWWPATPTAAREVSSSEAADALQQPASASADRTTSADNELVARDPVVESIGGDALANPAPRPSPGTDRVTGAPLGAGILIDTPRRLDAGEVPAEGGWLVVADMPPELDGRHGEAFAGDAGRLLQNMLRALPMRDASVAVHLMRTHRGVASGQPGSPAPLTDVFGEAAAALAPRVVLAMGPLAAQSLLQSAEALGKLRGRVQRLSIGPSGIALIATYPPGYLLRNPADKARAWADLCLAAEQFGA